MTTIFKPLVTPKNAAKVMSKPTMTQASQEISTRPFFQKSSQTLTQRMIKTNKQFLEIIREARIEKEKSIQWNHLIDFAQDKAMILNKRCLVQSLLGFSEIYANVSQRDQTRIKEIANSLIMNAASKLQTFSLEQLIQIMYSQSKLIKNHDFNALVLSHIVERQIPFDDIHHLVRLLQTKVVFVKSLDPKIELAFNDFIVKQCSKLNPSKMDPHQFTIVLKFLSDDASYDLVKQYLQYLGQRELLKYNMDQFILVIQSLINSTEQNPKLCSHLMQMILDTIEVKALEKMEFTGVQAATLLASLDLLLKKLLPNIQDEGVESNVQRIGEIISISSLSMVNEDYGLIYLVLFRLKPLIHRQELFFNDALCFELLKIFNQNPSALDGSIINVVGSIGVQYIDFWVKVEDIYLHYGIINDPHFKLVEGFIGLAYVNRGSSAFLQQLQDRILASLNDLKTKDLLRCIYGISLLPPQKRSDALMQGVIANIKRINDLESLPLIDLVTLFQAFTNLDPESDVVMQTQAILTKKGSDLIKQNQAITSLFEAIAKLQSRNRSLETMLLETFADRYHEFSLKQFSQIVLSIKSMSERARDETQTGNRYEDVLIQIQERLVLNESHIGSFTLKKMLKVLDLCQELKKTIQKYLLLLNRDTGQRRQLIIAFQNYRQPAFFINFALGNHLIVKKLPIRICQKLKGFKPDQQFNQQKVLALNMDCSSEDGVSPKSQISQISKSIKKSKDTQKSITTQEKQKNPKKAMFEKLKQKKQLKSNLFKDRVINKQSADQVSLYLNQEIQRHIAYTRVKKGPDENILKAFDKFESLKSPALFNPNNMDQSFCNQPLIEQTKTLVSQMLQQGISCKKLSIPQIMIVTPDTQVVVDTFKALREAFSRHVKGKKAVQVRIQKLFAKHISVEEQEKLLTQDVPGRFLNVYIGTPNRLKKLCESNAISLNKPKFKHLIIDASLNVKNCSVFDIQETRDDAYDLIMLCFKQIYKQRLTVSIL